MGGLYRSQEMTYVSITMAETVARDTIHTIGNLGVLHVVDLNADQTQKLSTEYLDQKRRLAEVGKWVSKLTEYVKILEERYKIKLQYEEYPYESKQVDIISSVNEWITPLEEEYLRNQSFLDANNNELTQAIERKYVLELMQTFEYTAKASELTEEMFRRAEQQEGGEEVKSVNFGKRRKEDKYNIEMQERKKPKEGKETKNFITGVIPEAKEETFRRMLYRIARGNCLVGFKNFPEPTNPEEARLYQRVEGKTVFWVISVGEDIGRRAQKVAQLFGATIFDVPGDLGEWESELATVRREITDKYDVHEKTQHEIEQLLERFVWSQTPWTSRGGEQTGYSPLKSWLYMLHKESCIVQTLMKCHYHQSFVSLEGWVPTADLASLKTAVKDAVAGTGLAPGALEENPAHPLAPIDMPPTYFPTNKFTRGFQDIVNTYGVPRYGEVNPGLFTISTFPFLFGVMYGDIGHGIILTISISYLLFRERALVEQQKRGEMGDILRMIFGGRYTILCMGLFATYAGFVYNDCFSIPTHFHQSMWNWNNDTQTYQVESFVYPFGVDVGWYHTNNQLVYFNSLKMKISVTLGVTQMMFGLILSLMNHLHFGDGVSIIFEFIPRVLFLLCTFGYMIAIILVKFCIDWSANPPSLIQTMIKLFLSPGKVESDMVLYEGQATVQLICLIIALISIPCMLFPKPLINRHRASHSAYHEMQEEHEQKDNTPIEVQLDEEEKDFKEEKKIEEQGSAKGLVTKPPAHGHGHGPYSFSDDMIHQGIHTIEFVLGTVSNTASYLRLWALSLAHAELAEVFWDKILMDYGILSGNVFIAFVCFAIWAGATTAVLLCMDVLECFLHALRLHWVEFQNKFYYADGYKYNPFTFVKNTDED